MPRFKKNKVLSAIIMMSVFSIMQSANAGGLHAQDFGDPSMGRANAGAAAGVDDASTALHNPAYMTELSNEQVMAAAGIIYTDIRFDLDEVKEETNKGAQAGTDEGGNAGGFIPGASLFYVNPINDQWAWGFSFSATSAGILDYDNDWVGRYDVDELTLTIVGASPSVAYKVNDWLSVGVALEFLYGEAELSLASPGIGPFPEGDLTVEDNDTVISYNLSATIKVDDKTRIGIRYQPSFTLELDDVDVTKPDHIDPNNIITVDLDYAQYIRMGITHDISNELTVHGTIGWDDWSTMNDIPVQLAGQEVAVNTQLEDTYHAAFGVTYKLSDTWLVNSGISYDTSPMKQQYRYSQLALDEQMRIAVGAQYNYGKPFSIGAQFLILDAGKAKIDKEDLYYSGEYESNRAYMLMVNANWAF